MNVGSFGVVHIMHAVDFANGLAPVRPSPAGVKSSFYFVHRNVKAMPHSHCGQKILGIVQAIERAIIKIKNRT